MKQTKSFALLTLLAAMCTPLATWAEGACPQGQRMVGQQSVPGAVSPICQPIPDYNQTSQPPQVFWADRWGAIAVDEKAGAGGTAVNQESESKARKTALADCTQSGAQNCEIVITYGNQCVAAAGSNAHSAYSRALKLEDAQSKAIRTCDDNCKIVYSACSLPVRLQ